MVPRSTPVALAALAAATPVFLTSPPEARAQGLERPARVYQVPVQAAGEGVSPLVPQRTDRQLRKELGVWVEMEMIPEVPVQLDAQEVPLDPTERLEAAREHARNARAQAEQDELAGAVNLQGLAVAGLEADAVHLERFGELVDAYLALAFLHIRLEQLDRGDEMLQKVVTLAPDYEPDLSAQPQMVREVFGSVRRRVTRRKRGALLVKAPQATKVSVDGRPAGSPPARVADLLPGEHWVIARPESGDPLLARVQTSDGTTEIDLGAAAASASGAGARDASQADVVRRLRKGRIDARAKKPLAAFAKAIDADAVVLGYLERAGAGYALRAFVYRRDGDRLAEVEQGGRLDRELANLNVEIFGVAGQIQKYVERFPEDRDITGVAADDRRGRGRGRGETAAGLVEVDREEDRPEFQPAPPWYKRWWFWTAVGVVAAGAGGGAYFVLSQRGDDGLRADLSWQR